MDSHLKLLFDDIIDLGDCGEATFSQTSTLKLTKPNYKKRSHAGTEQSEILIEESSSDVKKCGQVVQSEEGMVDCLARYDKEKGYVLEVVDLLISNLQSSAEAVPNKEESTCDKEKASTDADRQQFDPLTKAKRAVLLLRDNNESRMRIWDAPVLLVKSLAFV